MFCKLWASPHSLQNIYCITENHRPKQKEVFYAGWQEGQMKLLVPPVLIFSMVAPQRGQGWPSR